MHRPLKIFCSYAHEDADIMRELRVHLSSLRRKEQIEDWDDRKIPAGGQWAQEIEDQLNTADIVLLLISADFINSDYCMKIETARALQRIEEDNISVIPIFTRECVIEGLSFAGLDGRPKDCAWIAQQSSTDKAYTEVVNAISELVRQYHASSKPVLAFVKPDAKGGGKPPLTRWLVLVLLLSLGYWGAYQYYLDLTAPKINAWDSLLLQGEYAIANNLCTNVQQVDTSYATAQECLAITQLMLDKTLGSLVFLAQAEAITRNYPDSAYALAVMAEAYAGKEQWHKAEQAYQQALQKQPNFAQAYFGLGQLAHTQKQPKIALEHYQHALKLAPENKRFLHNLASLYVELAQTEQADERLTQATENFKQLLQEDANLFLPYVEWIEALQLQGKFSEALQLGDALQEKIIIADLWQKPLNKQGWVFKTEQDYVYLRAQGDKQYYIKTQSILSAYALNRIDLAEERLQALSKHRLPLRVRQLIEYQRQRLNKMHPEVAIPNFAETFNTELELQELNRIFSNL
ncbi:MAG: TIR domain-containing protein [Methyloprofundus sp.]|nr:TIR domain-containing protein [Methyloprofundus sp.]